MEYVQTLSVLGITVAAVLCDIAFKKIPNILNLAGLICAMVYQLWIHKAAGFLLFAGGAALPLLLFAVFYYFRMIGAGDIKLMSTIGSFLGPDDCLEWIAASMILAALMAAVRMLYFHNTGSRISALIRFAQEYRRSGQWRPYMEEVPENARFCFSIPLLLGILYHLFKGGII